MKSVLAVVFVAIQMIAGSASASEGIRVKSLHFPPGKTGMTLRDRIVGRESISYMIGAEAGQTMAVSLKSTNAATYFNIYEPGRGPGDQALAAGDLTGPMMPDINRFKGKLPASGAYTISVYLYRSAARRNERSNFTLDISVSALGASDIGKPVANDYADGLQGGPDYWDVTTGGDAGRLTVRAGPSAASAGLGQVHDGTVLRNMGCRMNEGRRWCRVATLDAPVVTGWAAGDFLRESRTMPEQ